MPRTPISALPASTVLGLLMACGGGPTDDTEPNSSGTADNPCAGTAMWYRDVDNDGYGDPQVTSSECDMPIGFVDNALDCNDDDRDINPDAVEVCDPENDDENCDGLADNDDPAAEGKLEAWPDLDMDGFGVEGQTAW